MVLFFAIVILACLRSFVLPDAQGTWFFQFYIIKTNFLFIYLLKWIKKNLDVTTISCLHFASCR